MLFVRGVLLPRPGVGLRCMAAVLVLVLVLGLERLVLVFEGVAVVESAKRSGSPLPRAYGLPCPPC